MNPFPWIDRLPQGPAVSTGILRASRRAMRGVWDALREPDSGLRLVYKAPYNWRTVCKLVRFSALQLTLSWHFSVGGASLQNCIRTCRMPMRGRGEPFSLPRNTGCRTTPTLRDEKYGVPYHVYVPRAEKTRLLYRAQDQGATRSRPARHRLASAPGVCRKKRSRVPRSRLARRENRPLVPTAKASLSRAWYRGRHSSPLALLARYRGRHFSAHPHLTWCTSPHFSTCHHSRWYRGPPFSARFPNSGTAARFSRRSVARPCTLPGFSRRTVTRPGTLPSFSRRTVIRPGTADHLSRHASEPPGTLPGISRRFTRLEPLPRRREIHVLKVP